MAILEHIYQMFTTLVSPSLMIPHFDRYFNLFLSMVMFLEKKSIIVPIFAIAVLAFSVFGSKISFSGITYSETSLPDREPYRLTSSGGDKLNLNTVSPSVLKTLPYVGKYADEICELREELGGFSSLEELALIPGIGAETVDRASEILKIN